MSSAFVSRANTHKHAVFSDSRERNWTPSALFTWDWHLEPFGLEPLSFKSRWTSGALRLRALNLQLRRQLAIQGHGRWSAEVSKFLHGHSDLQRAVLLRKLRLGGCSSVRWIPKGGI
eukprot:s4121_g6.t1